jgi:hypothetical protein
MYKNTRDFVEKWSEERKAGLKGYRISQFKSSFVHAAKAFVIMLIILTAFQIAVLGFHLNDFYVVISISATAFVLIPLYVLLYSSELFQETEKLYAECLNNLEKYSEEKRTESKVKMEYPGYKQLKLLTKAFYFIALLGIGLLIFGLINPMELSLVVVFLPWILFFAIYKYLLSHFKNPACNHLIFDDSRENRHPDVEGTLGDNIRDILTANKYKCFQCGFEYFVSQENGKYYIEN